jgi:hypothetical protein
LEKTLAEGGKKYYFFFSLLKKKPLDNLSKVAMFF